MSATIKKWMIYGANGYTGKIIAEEAVKRKLKPILAGRNKEEIKALAEKLNLEYRIFPCADPVTLCDHLTDIDLVLHCAGPFSKTAEPMLAACLKSKTHYLDITGEISVFEMLHAKDAEAKTADIMAMSGVGFDVVPTDCLASMLHEKLPDANEINLALFTQGAPSPGTSKTMIENLDKPGMVRRDKKLKTIPTGSLKRELTFSHGKLHGVSIPWGDVSTAYHSTGVPNITVYFAETRFKHFFLNGMRALMHAFLKTPFTKNLPSKMVDLFVKGPNEKERQEGKCILWGEAKNIKGKTIVMELYTPEVYDLTVDAALTIVEKLLKGEIKHGVHTPSKAFGANFVLGLKGVTLRPIQSL